MAKYDSYIVRPEQVLYAKILFYGAWLSIAIMVVTYFLYVTGLIDPHVSMELVVNNWDKSVSEYRQITNSPDGWNWVPLLGKGDFLNFLGIALLAIMTIICFITLIPTYLKRKEFTYATIAALEILVLVIAASGFLGSGGH